MSHFFVLPESIKNNKVTICGEEARHIVKVLRKKEGDLINIFDGIGNRYAIKITHINNCSIRDSNQLISLEGEIITDKQCFEDDFHVVLYQSILKSNKMDLIVQKCTEIGVHSIIPFLSNRCVVNYDENTFGKKIVRWQNISLQAAKQSFRSKIPKIELPMSFSDLLPTKENELRIIFWEKETINLKKILKKYIDKMSNIKQKPIISIFIGPEGGFSETEIEEAKRRDIVSASLGENILRAETAGLVALSMIFYEYAF